MNPDHVENTMLPDGSDVSVCPGCTFSDPHGNGFAVCPRCGLVVSKYLERKQRQAALESVNHDTPPKKFLLHHVSEHWKTIITAALIMCAVSGIFLFRGAPPANRAGDSKNLAAEEFRYELFSAVKKNDLGMVKTLLSRHKYPSDVLSDKRAVGAALLAENIPIARMLVDKGAKIPVAPQDNEPALIQECVLRNLVLSVSYLLSLNIPLEDLTPKGEIILFTVTSNGYTEMVKVLLDAGKSVNYRSKAGWTALHIAAYKHNTEMVRLLISRGADVNSRGVGGYTPLMDGIGSEDIVKLLLDAGADANARTDNNFTPLHCAVSKLKPKSLKLLLEKGADVSVKDDRGFTPLKLGMGRRNPIPDPFPEMAAMLKNAGAQE